MTGALAAVQQGRSRPRLQTVQGGRNGTRQGRVSPAGVPTLLPAGAVPGATAHLLATKLHLPAVRPDWLPRPRLLEQLEAGLDRQLTLISAPAGAGKTSLLRAWLASRQSQTAWLSLDRGDSDPLRFWAYVVAALQTVNPQIGRTALAHLCAPLGDGAEAGGAGWVYPFLTPLVNDLAAAGERIILVLDDYYLISSQAVHDSLAYFLKYQPPLLHLVISTRADPPLPVVRLRAQGQLSEQRFDDLCFTSQETATLLNDRLALGLEAPEVAALARRTEGWIVGLQLAAVSLKGHPDPQAFVAAFAGSHYHVVTYLLEEVLQRLPDAVQSFLLRSSILERLSGPLCDALANVEPAANGAGQEPGLSGQQMLEHLYRENLFLLPLDDECLWYRYHSLFADLLRHRAAQRYTAAHLLALHRRASQWHETHGTLDEAVKHAVRAGDLERVATLAERAIQASILDSWLTTLQEWLAPLPPAMLHAHPRLRMYHAWALFLNGHVEQVDGALQAARAAVDALPATAGGQALREELSLSLDAMLSIAASLAAVHEGDLDRAIQHGTRGTELAERAGDIFLAALATRGLALAHRYRGHLRKAAHFCEQAVALARSRQAGIPERLPLPLAAMAYVEWARVHIEYHQLDAATRCLHEAMALCQRAGGARTRVEVHVARSRLRLAQGDLEGARAALDAARRIVHVDAPWSLTRFRLAAQSARVHLAAGELDQVSRWVTTAPLPFRDALRPLQARVHLAQGEPELALACLPSLDRRDERRGQLQPGVEIALLQALALDAQGQRQAALDALEQSLNLAEPEGHLRPYLEAGPAAIRLLAAFSQGRSRPAHLQRYALTILRSSGQAPDGERFASAADTASVGAAAQPLVDPLTPREMDVLRLLRTELTSPEIAQELIIAVSTVRSHVKSIYSKLDVHNRLEAIQQATALQLL